MKKKEQNNPVVIGSLLVVLLGALVVIVRSLSPTDELKATPAPPDANAAASAGADSPAAL